LVSPKKSNPSTPPNSSRKKLLPRPLGPKPNFSTFQDTAQVASAFTSQKLTNFSAETSSSPMASVAGTCPEEVETSSLQAFRKKFSLSYHKLLFILAMAPPPPSVAKPLRTPFYKPSPDSTSSIFLKEPAQLPS
jgi:hypothetical protein